MRQITTKTEYSRRYKELVNISIESNIFLESYYKIMNGASLRGQAELYETLKDSLEYMVNDNLNKKDELENFEINYAEYLV